MFKNFGVSFKEPSTWQGIITVLTLVGISLDPVQKEVIVSAGIALYAFLDVFWLHNSQTP